MFSESISLSISIIQQMSTLWHVYHTQLLLMKLELMSLTYCSNTEPIDGKCQSTLKVGYLISLNGKKIFRYFQP